MLPFTKVEGLGNDFVVVDLRGERAATKAAASVQDPDNVRRICDRHFGVGADGASRRALGLVIVGDAAMHPGELMEAGGSLYSYTRNVTPGIEWMRRLREHFRRSAWLNPEPEQHWNMTTVRVLRGLYPMFPLTIDGIHDTIAEILEESEAGGRTPLTAAYAIAARRLEAGRATAGV